jgi:phosphohistidine swiveling domain-containing protein
MIRSPLLVFQNSHQATRPELVGAKAARLTELSRQGFSVPAFFIITTKACERFFNHADRQHIEPSYLNSKRPPLQRFLAELTNCDNLQVPPPVAVRSSAPFEDQSQFSLAGQFETMLNVNGIENIWEAAQKCWRSLDRPQVQSYFRQFDFSPGRRRMAVLVQRMITTRMAGVIFTQHPVTNDLDTLLIEIVEGRGDSLVSGQLEPIRLLVDKRTKEISFLTIESSAKGKHSTFLSTYRNTIDQLIKTALEIEKVFTCPQDIEWALEEDKIWILQARPITHPASRARNYIDAEGMIWTDYFFVERFAKPLSTLGWTLLQAWVEKNAFRDPLWYLGNDQLAKQKRLTGLIQGFPYTNLAVFQRLYALIPLSFISKDKTTSLLLDRRRKHWWQELVKALPYLIIRMLPKDLNWLPYLNLRFWRKFTQHLETELPALERTIRQSSAAGILDSFQKIESLSGWLLALHRWSITFADVFFVLLQKFIKHWIRVAPESLIADLLTGLPGNSTVETNLALAHLAESFAGNQEDFPQGLDVFLRKHGHRSESLDILQPSWREKPEAVIELAAHIRRTGKAEQIRTDYHTSVLKHQAASALCTKQLSRFNPIARYFRSMVFHHILQLAQAFALLRENQRNEWHKILSVARLAVLHLGKNLAQGGRISQVDDVFFLTRNELFELTKSQHVEKEICKAISERKSAWQQLQAGTSRDAANEGQATSSPRNASSNSCQKLEGLGVSKGMARGQARVAFTLQEAGKAKAGEILIAHSADPSWTFLFGLLSGLVLEVGGVLSHASIVAREFGLPAVTSVAKATQFIRTGDLIQVDGEKGTVEMLEGASAKMFETSSLNATDRQSESLNE